MPIRPDYSALFAASPYPYLLVDTDFILIGANPAYLRATGRTEDDLVGKHIFDAFPADPAAPDSTNLDEVRRSIELAISTRKPHTSALLRYAVPVQTADGVAFDQRYWSAIHTPVFDAAGDVIFVSQNAIDVTELYRFDGSTGKYYLKQDANAVPDVPQLNRPQMHEAMTRILTAERSQLQTMFNQAPGFIAVLTGADHTFEMANQAFYQLVGYRDIIGKPASQALPELAGQGIEELMDTAFASGEPVVVRDRKLVLQRQPDAPFEDRYVDLLYQPIIGHDQRVTGIFLQGIDVTATHQANLALQEKIQQLEDARISQAFQLDLSDRLRQLRDPDDVTATACALLGQRLQASRVLYAEVDEDQGIVSIRRDWTAAGIPSLAGYIKPLDNVTPEILATLRAGDKTVNHDVSRDPRTADRSAVYQPIMVGAEVLVPLVRAGRLQVVLSIQSATPRFWHDHEIRLVGDIAERTWSAIETAHAQAALRSERDQSQYIFDSMTEGFAVLDRHWTIVRMNAEGMRITQRTAADLIGRNHWEVWPELIGTHAETVYRRVMATGRTEVIEIAHVMPDGARAWIEIRTYRSLDGGIAFFFRDVTERRATQEQLTHADQRKDEFLAMLAHELRNPLAPIRAAADLLQVAKLDEAGIRKTSQIIGRQVLHMTTLVDDLLDVSRVTRGLVELHTECLDLRHIVNDAIEQVTPLMRARRHQLGFELPPDAPLVVGDKKRLVQVLANLLNNAAKYTPEDGQITVSIDVRGTHVLLHVTDNGIGMAPEMVARAFDLFAQAERTSDRSLGGLGLGLALVKSLVALHEGTVHCDSAGIGHGSTFTVCLPRQLATEATGADKGAEPAALEPADAPLRIMLVDDNIDAATMLSLLLELQGHQVAIEHDAGSALAHAELDQQDVFLLDIGLPDIDGNEMAKRLRARPGTAGAVLIAITGYGQETDRAQTAAAGFDHHLVKPVDLHQLMAILAAITRQ
jgi:PAS domain S-box-containing protein